MMVILAALWAASTLADPSTYLMARPMSLEIRRDPITDRVSAYAVARADGVRLAVGCDPENFRGVRVMLSGRIWFAGESPVTGRRAFRYRFDDAAPQRSSWSTEDRSAIMRSRSRTTNFLAWMVASQQLVMRVRDIEGRELDIFFSLAGAREAVDGMLQACRADELRISVFGAAA